MSSKYFYVNEQQSIVAANGTTYFGRITFRNSSGQNQDKTKPLEPHNYSINAYDRYDCLVKFVRYDGTVNYGSYQCTGTRSRAWTSSDDYELYAKLEAKYDLGEFNAGVFAGELGETVDMLADRTKQLAKALLAAKKGRFAQAAYILGVGGDRKVSPSTRHRHRDDAGPQHPQSISGGWLELQYGWKPLVGDIFALADQIAKADKPRQKRIFAKQDIRVKPDTSSYLTVSAAGGGKYGKSIVAYITEDIPSWPQALGLMDPELVAWEVVPFSFVVDWFYPVGSWLQARAFAQRAKGKFVTTTRDIYHVHITGIVPPAYVNGWTKTLVQTGWYRYVNMQRVVTDVLPSVPLPVFNVEGLTGSGIRLYNAAALLTGIFGKRIGWSPTSAKRLK